MFGKLITNKTNLPVLYKAMDAATLRNKVIANNIANVTTAGYKRVEVSFEEELRNALDRTRLKGTKTKDNHIDLGRKDLSSVNAVAYHPYDPTLPSGVNNVDIDMEMAKLAENQITYNYAIKFGQGVFKKLNAAIQGRTIPLQ